MAGGMGGEVFHRALVKCRDLGSDKVEVESDALSIIQMLNGERSIDARLECLLFDIKALASHIREVKFMFVQRSGNIAAHDMA
ncbi:unnamed protein product [Malus baccata var. baccata]